MSRHFVNNLLNLLRTAPMTCAGVQFGAMHLAKICTCIIRRTAPITVRTVRSTISNSNVTKKTTHRP